MNKMIFRIKNFFGINDQFKLEWADISTLLTLANVSLIIAGAWWAPMIGISNSIASCAIGIPHKSHINFYITQLALVVLNIFFLI